MFQTGNDMSHTLDELQGITAFRRIHDLPINMQRIVHGNDLTIIDFCLFRHLCSPFFEIKYGLPGVRALYHPVSGGFFKPDENY